MMKSIATAIVTKSAAARPAATNGKWIPHRLRTIVATACLLTLLVASRPAKAEVICQDGFCVQTYPGFDTDLTNILARQDNTIRPVDAAKKRTLVNNVVAFAGSIGIPKQAIQRQASGRYYGKKVVNGDIDAYFKQDADFDLRASAVLKARRTTRFRTAAPPIPDAQLKQIADGTIAQWHVPLLNAGETLTFASFIHTREVDDDIAGPRVITERVGYYRAIRGRQVVNSALKVEVDPGISMASGLSLRAFWPLRAPQATTLKPFDLLKSAVLKALWKNGNRTLTLDVSSCRPTYFQAPAVLIPSVTCEGEFINPLGGERDDDTEGVSVDVSLASPYLLDEADEISVYESSYPDDSDTVEISRGPLAQSGVASCAERDGFAFHAYYTSSEDRFYDGAKEFYDEFDSGSREANLGLAWHDSRFVDTPCEQYGADWSDLVYVVAHGAPKYFEGENDDIFLTDSDVTTVTQLGRGDAEYLISTACSTTSPIYCDGRTAVSRYTESSGYHSVFYGLQIYASHNGTSINSSSSRHKKRARTLSEYLNDGATVIEAWEDTADDVSVWNNNIKRKCGEMKDPDGGCGFNKPWNDCSRWSAYASSFYQDGKEYVTLNNRGDYSDDVNPDEAGYDIDLRYQYQSETVPMYSPGYSLP